MEETQTPTQTEKKKLTKEERSQIAKAAATRRWKKEKNVKKTSSKRSQLPKHKPTNRREFSSALKAAEKRMEKAIQERAEAGAKYAILYAEIISLQRIIQAFGPSNGIPDTRLQPVSLEQIVSDQPLPHQNPVPPSWSPAIPAQHPVNAQGRAQGGAIGVELQEEDEEKFLRESPVSGGEWR